MFFLKSCITAYTLQTVALFEMLSKILRAKNDIEDDYYNYSGARENQVRGGVIWSWAQKMHRPMATLTLDRCQSNGNDHLSYNRRDFKGGVKINV